MSGDTGCSEGTVGGAGETGRGRDERRQNKSGSTTFWESVFLLFSRGSEMEIIRK